MWKLTWVESLEARVISKLPFNHNKAGTSMNNSWISSKTFQCWTISSTKPAPTIPKPATRNGNKISKVIEQNDSEFSGLWIVTP